jgi:hypothetical protein
VYLFVFLALVQDVFCKDYSGEVCVSTATAPRGLQECFSMCSAGFALFGKVQVPVIFEYRCEGCTSSSLTPNGIHECFSRFSAMFRFSVKD